MALVECVPNFSEGRDPEVLRALVAAAEEAHATVLDASQDADHHRAVVTLVAEPARVTAIGCALAEVALARIDLREHRGVHPRIGALDVFPIVPLEGVTLDDGARLAKELALALFERLGLPAFLYGHGAPHSLPEVRKGGLAGLTARLAEGWRPVAGPAQLHPTAGAVAIGARPFLIAFNVLLATSDLGIAQAIARELRERDGGLPAVRALGLELASQGRVQVSMNLVDHEVTGLERAFQEVERRATARGVDVVASELIGLAPAAALDAALAERIRMPHFDPAHHVLESRLAHLRETSR